ncbi:MAG: GTP cyclohydrolase FolE2 [Spirochaetota bacterium]|nr:GTP cyclohydrolase FolE2 [Spirochaetota bacterium]
MVDVQNQIDIRNIAINKVGIKKIKYPISVLDRQNKIQHTVADINMSVSLPKQFKGTHMSRFIEVINKYKREIKIENIDEILNYIKVKLNAQEAHLEMSFPYFIEKSAPVSGEKGLMDYICRIHAKVNGKNETDLILGVSIPITTLCPCSKEISKFGAHNQRSEVTILVRMTEFVWLEELISLVESSGSCEIYSLLKREDEKYVTEQAYENPVFVEDVVREVTEKLSLDKRIIWFTVESENFESIHNHNAYAFIERDFRD